MLVIAKWGDNGYCLASDSLFFCYIYSGEGINIDFTPLAGPLVGQTISAMNS